MSIPVPEEWSNAYLNADLLAIYAESGFHSGVIDPDGIQLALPADIDDEALGAAVLQTLSASRFVDPDVSRANEDLFDKLYNFENTAKAYNAWVDTLLSRFEYKNRRSLFKDLKNCRITRSEGTISFKPSRHEKSEAWSGTGLTAADTVVIPADSAPGEIGAALRLAFSRCI